MASRLPVLGALLAGLAACSFPTGGVPLEGDDPDAAVPPDACVPADEVCNGVDDDCDGEVDDGVSSQVACDGPDDDLCMDDVMVCDAGGAEVCADGDDAPELCNAADDDCDGQTDEGFPIGDACDGADGDACEEGTLQCAPDGQDVVCNDTTGTIAEACNGDDDDCDGIADDGFDLDNDVDNCGECELACTNANGTTACSMATCAPVCNPGFAVCGAPEDGCELVDTNPTCSEAGGADLTVRGDNGSDVVEDTGTEEAWLEVRVRESVLASSDEAIKASIELVSGAGTDFDLTVRCVSCAGGEVAVTEADDGTDTATLRRNDQSSVDRGFDVLVHVRWTSGSTCAPWTLTVRGNVAVAAATAACN